MIVLNFKTYNEVTISDSAIKLTHIAQEVFDQYKIPIILCVQATDVYKVSQNTSLPVFSQHIDPIHPGKNTGYISALSIKENGGAGTLINHSEHRLDQNHLLNTLKIAKDYDLQTLVCVEKADEAEMIDSFYPDMIALEDPVLIGGDVSIVKNEEGKQKVQEFVNKNLKAKTLVGAGVKTKDDIISSRQIGAVGVLLASGFALAKEPKKILSQLCEGFF